MICPCGCPNTVKIPSPRKMFKRSDPLMPISIYLATWNVLSRPPDEDLKALLGLENISNVSLPDIYAFGLQEVKAAPYSILMDNIFESSWVKAFRLTLAPFNYVKVRVIRLQGMLLALFIKRQHLVYIQEIETDYTRTGIGRVWGNKGAVSIRLNAFGCSICIVNCHLAAHDTELKRRIEDYNMIVDSQLFKYPQTENIFFHDYVFWLGDLNFRLDTKPIDEIISNITRKNYNVLLDDDQLRQVRQNGEAFSELEEHPIQFAPTYKFTPGSNDYDISRRPAWTDRILHKVNAHVYEDVTLDAQVKNYNSISSYSMSDHKPVTALYSIKVFQALPDRYVQFAPIKTWLVGKQCHVTFYLRTGILTTVWDWIGLYKADFTNLDDYIAYIWVSGHGIAQSVPPVSPAFGSDYVIETFDKEDHTKLISHDTDSSWRQSDAASGSGVFMNSWIPSGRTSQQDSCPPSQMTSGFTSQIGSRQVSLAESPTHDIGPRLHSLRQNMDTLPFGTGKHTSKSKEGRRSSRSHSPARRISTHISTAVIRLASLFQAVPKTKYVVTFPELLAPEPGQYCMLYLSHGVDNVHGMSEPFEIQVTSKH